MSETLSSMDMPHLARHTLVRKYAFYISGLVGALLVLSGGIGGYFAFRQSTSALDELQGAKAHFAADEIQSFVGRVEDALQRTVEKFNTEGAVDDENLRLELFALLRHQREISELHWIAPDGSDRLTLSRTGRDTVDSGQTWLGEPIFEGARIRRKYVGPVSFRAGTEPYLPLAVSRNAGGPVLVAQVNLKFVADVISKIHIGSTGVAYVVDQRGRLVSHPDTSLVLGNTDFSMLPQVEQAFGTDPTGWTTGRARNIQGRPVLSTAVPLEHLGWTVFAEQGRDEAFRPVYASMETSAALVLVGLIAAIATSSILARHMVRPIRAIEAAARKIGEGTLDERIELRTGDELEALGLQFNRMAARLQDTYATLETRIAERTHDLAVANEAKTRFLAVASHDLRQPIHALALFVGQLRASSDPVAGRGLMERIARSVAALEELLDALLDLSKLDVGAVAAYPREFPIHDLLERLVEDFAPSAEAKGLALTLVPTSVWVRSDPLLLERIVVNLVANAIRYTFQGRILLGCLRRGDKVHVVIADSGVGIAAQHLPNVFQEFYRVGPLRSGTTQGLGLGLAIVKRLTVILDHPISIQSVLERGTMIRVEVPRSVSGAPVTPSRAVIGKDLRGTRVLVVDDDVDARVAMQGLLAQWGCEVMLAAGGDEALDETRQWRPDLVVCDLNLGGGESGLHVVERLRSKHGPGLACAFVTGESTSERVVDARKAGFEITFKPAKPGKLRALIEYLLRSQSWSAKTTA